MKRSFTWFWIAGSLFLMGLSASSVSAQTANFVSSGACPAISYTLYADRTDSDTGGQVTRLQQYLKDTVVRNSSGTAVSVYPDGLITGFFGPLTEQAVERFQCALGIVCSGEPNTTGYGQVGPRTQALMNANCGGSTGTVSTGSGSTMATGSGNGSNTSSDAGAATPNPSSAPELELVSVNPGTTHTGSGGFPSMTVVVRNNGGNTGNTSFTVRGTPPTGGSVMPVFQTTSTAVSPGQSKTITVPNTTPGLSIPAGTYSYTITVDSNNTTQDSNRTNNTTTVSITVGSSATTINVGTPSGGTGGSTAGGSGGAGGTGGSSTGSTGSTLPDLVLGDIRTNPTYGLPETVFLSANLNASITVTLKPENTTLSLPSFTSWDYSKQSANITLSQSSAYGGSFKLRATDIPEDTEPSLPSGTYRYIATVDSGNTVAESNESNNTSYWYYNTTAGLIYPEGQRGDPGPGGCTAGDGTTARNNETIKIYSVRQGSSLTRCSLSGATRTQYFLDYSTNWCRNGSFQKIQDVPGHAAGVGSRCPLLKPAPFVKITPVNPAGTKVSSGGTSSAYNLGCVFKNQDIVYDVELIGSDLGIQEPSNWRVVSFGEFVREATPPNPLNLARAGMTTAGYSTALFYPTDSSGQTTGSGDAVVTQNGTVTTVPANQVSIQQISSSKVRVTAKVGAYYPGITFPQPVQVAVDIKTDTAIGKTTLKALLYYNPGNPYYYLHPTALAGGELADALFFSGFDDEGAVSGACQDPKNIAQRTQVTTSSGGTGNQTQVPTTPTLPEGVTWYVRATGATTSNGSREYETPLGKIYKSPLYGNWFVTGGSGAALATSNSAPSFQQVWDLLVSAGITPTFVTPAALQLPGILPRSENLGFSDPEQAYTKFSGEYLPTKQIFSGNFRLPALNMPTLPEGSDHQLLRELSFLLNKRVIGAFSSDQQAAMTELLRAQGYGEFLSGGRWYTLVATSSLLITLPPTNLPLGYRIFLPGQVNSVTFYPVGPAEWGTRFISASSAAGWINSAVNSGAFVTGVNMARYAPSGESGNTVSDQATLRAAIANSLNIIPPEAVARVRAVYTMQGFKEFLPNTTGSTPVPTGPAVSSFNPNSGVIGTQVTITGSGFSTATGGNTVIIGTQEITGLSSSNNGTTLSFMVPSSLAVGVGYQIKVRTSAGTSQPSSSTFLVSSTTANSQALVTTLTTDKASYAPGEKIQATLTVRNTSATPQTYFAPYCSAGINLELSYGPLTSTGQARMSLIEPQATCLAMGGSTVSIPGNGQVQWSNTLLTTIAIPTSAAAGPATLEASVDAFTATKNLTITTVGTVGGTQCPAMPTIGSCPAGEERYVTYSSAECGTYYACRPVSGSGSSQTSTVLVRRVQQDESTTQANTSSGVDQGTPAGDTNGLATFTGVPAGSRTVFSTDLADKTETAGYCQFPTGGSGCSVTTFTLAMDCTGSRCNVTVPVSAGQTTRVAFKYSPLVTTSSGNQTIDTFQDVVRTSWMIQQTYNDAANILGIGSASMQPYRDVERAAENVFNAWEGAYLALPAEVRGTANSNGTFDNGRYVVVKQMFQSIKQREQAAGVSSTGGSSPPATTTTGATTGGTTGAPSVVNSSGNLDLTNVQFFPKNQIGWPLEYDFRIKSGGSVGANDLYTNPDATLLAAAGAPGQYEASAQSIVNTGAGVVSSALGGYASATVTGGVISTVLAGGIPTWTALSPTIVGAAIGLLITVAIGSPTVGPHYVAVLSISGGQCKITAAAADNGANENTGRILGQTVINVVTEVARQKGKTLQNVYVGRIGDYKNLYFINTNVPENESTNTWYAYPEAAAASLAEYALNKSANITLTPEDKVAIYGKLVSEFNDYRVNSYRPAEAESEYLNSLNQGANRQ